MAYYQEIYTIGCFDHFHHGHQTLLENMRKYGKTIIVGIHDDQSLEKLKNLKPEDHLPLSKRMESLKPHVDVVFVVPSTDPTLFLKMIHNSNESSQCYIRADDMQDFPGIEYIRQVMPIKYLPYTQGISSTQIRQAQRMPGL